MKLFYIILFMATLLILAFCDSSFAVDNINEQEYMKEYIIGVGDIIQINIWQYEQFSGSMTVGPDGKITVPLLGDVVVAGLTRKQVKEELIIRLSKFVKTKLEDSDVTVSITQFNSQKIFVFGSVQNPKTLTFFSPPSLLEVMIQVSPTPDADLTAVKVISSDPSIRGTITVNMVDALKKGDTSQLPKLHSGDTVYIPKIEKAASEKSSTDTPNNITTPLNSTTPPESPANETIINVMGAATTGSFSFKKEPTLTEVLVRAGGVSNQASLKNIRVIRSGAATGYNVINVDFEKYLLEGDDSLLPKLYSGDTIYILPVTQERMAKVAIIITGAVFKPGSYEISGPMDLIDALSMAGGPTLNADIESVRLRRETSDSYQDKIVNIKESLTNIRSNSPPEMVGPGYKIYVPTKEANPATVVASATNSLARFLFNTFEIYSFYRFVK